MCNKCVNLFADTDIAILSAAVADYAPATCSESKIKREKTDSMTIELVKNPDIAATLGKMKSDSQMLVGFALETDNEKENAIRKINNKNLDWIVLNSLKDKEAGFQKDTNKITMLSRIGQEIPFDAKLKTEVAKDIIDTIIGK
jgi:phosphopantothenoylcysteine decarboxylase/phosphopantothenate--cysteine ligase